ncbi:MAG: IS200/IS605 family transposase [Verrucomicrobiota bacterium]
MEYRRGNHCVWCCQYHVVLPTKYRRKIINGGLCGYLEQKVREIQEHYPQIKIEEFNHDEDHVHLFMWIPPQMSVGSAIRVIKSNMSRGLKEKFGYLKKVYWGTDGIWSEGYFVSTVGINEKTIRRYIQMQGDQDGGQATLELG